MAGRLQEGPRHQAPCSLAIAAGAHNSLCMTITRSSLAEAHFFSFPSPRDRLEAKASTGRAGARLCVRLLGPGFDWSSNFVAISLPYTCLSPALLTQLLPCWTLALICCLQRSLGTQPPSFPTPSPPLSAFGSKGLAHLHARPEIPIPGAQISCLFVCLFARLSRHVTGEGGGWWVLIIGRKWGRRWLRDASQAVRKLNNKAHNDNNWRFLSICPVFATLLNALFNTLTSFTPLDNPRRYILLPPHLKWGPRRGEKSELSTCFLAQGSAL